MATRGQTVDQQTSNRASPSGRVLTPSEVKTRLHKNGETVKSWAAANGYPYGTVSQVLRGVNRGTYGLGHSIAVALGLKGAAQ